MSAKHTPRPWETLERIAAMDVTNATAAVLARNEARDALQARDAALCDESFYRQERDALLAALRAAEHEIARLESYFYLPAAFSTRGFREYLRAVIAHYDGR